MKPSARWLIHVGLILLLATACRAQMAWRDSIAVALEQSEIKPVTPQRDVADLARHWFPRLHVAGHDSATLREGGRFLLVIPQVGYTLQTRALVGVLVNAAFRNPHANMSSMTGMLSYTQNNQAILTANALVWSADNRFLFSSDWRLMRYPQATYGLGMYTATDTRVVDMDYAYFRFYQSALRRLTRNFYGGVGCRLLCRSALEH